ncbi:short-chain dehydrogenase/reductase family 16C member 6 [Phlebotomus papatasi]|uniref:short-chain dehydrogenase/reductase family 16C member 6 n=1 Tax=Phlebotomus papatasi TaxID=29031 RepID=UPI0024845DE9|nr:short-chain dehydrogenase/reductase family 16C member 6 [Phlebotomus papatasi]
MAELLYENRVEHIYMLLWDLLVFYIKSFVYICEAFFLSITPTKFRNLKDVRNQVVLITGGGGGVGKLLALNFARLQSRVVIWDINQEAINATIDLVESEGYTCKGYVVDLANREKVMETMKVVREDVGNVKILINNAGTVCCKPLWDLPEKVIENTYAVNILSHYWTVKSCLDDMIESGGHIVTVASVAGMLGTYGCTDYSATKFACIGFHEALYTELRTHGHDNVNMTLVCPYYINTAMFAGVRPRLFPMLEPQVVADSIVSSVRKNEVNCVLPDSVRILMPLKHWLPSKVCWELMARVMKGPNSMMLFKGRGRVAAG